MTVETLAIQKTICMNQNYERTKRLLDLVFSLLILIPLCIIIGFAALCIRLDSKGPIFYRQKRVGQNGVEFDMLKFRSMYVDNDDAVHREVIKQYMNGEILNGNGNMPYKMGDDPRITRVGRIIRKTSL